MGISEIELEDAKLPKKGFVKGVMGAFKRLGKARGKKTPKATGSRVRSSPGKTASTGGKSKAGGRFAASAVTVGGVYGAYRLSKTPGKKQ